jgi:hypothetical protein
MVGKTLQVLAPTPDCVPYGPRIGSVHLQGTAIGIKGDKNMSLGTILLIVLVLLLIGALPTWPYSGNWGYFPSGGLGLVLIVLLVLVVSGRL